MPAEPKIMEVHLRPVTTSNLTECLQLHVREDQTEFVASTAKSMAEAKVNPTLYPLAIYDVKARGYEQPSTPVVGFAMYEISAGVGFIMRLLIDQQYQGRGYGKASMVELIRRLRLYPEVEIIAISHAQGNTAASHLYAGLGFIAWDIDYAKSQTAEIYLVLKN